MRLNAVECLAQGCALWLQQVWDWCVAHVTLNSVLFPLQVHRSLWLGQGSRQGKPCQGKRGSTGRPQPGREAILPQGPNSRVPLPCAYSILGKLTTGWATSEGPVCSGQTLGSLNPESAEGP